MGAFVISLILQGRRSLGLTRDNEFPLPGGDPLMAFLSPRPVALISPRSCSPIRPTSVRSH